MKIGFVNLYILIVFPKRQHSNKDINVATIAVCGINVYVEIKFGVDIDISGGQITWAPFVGTSMIVWTQVKVPLPPSLSDNVFRYLVTLIAKFQTVKD